MEKAILLLENEINRQNRILKIINDVLEYSNVYIAEDVATAYKIMVEKTIDIFIVNAVLEGECPYDVSGLRFVTRVREIPKYTLAPVIMISALDDPGLYAYEQLNCLGYLAKTFTTNTMKNLLRKASHFETGRKVDNTLFFRKSRVLYPVKVNDIVYINRENRNVCIHLADGSILEIPYVTFTDIIADADNRSLIMCNRSTIINRDYVYAVDPTNRYVILRDNRGMLDLGDRYRRKVILEFTNYSGIYCKKVNTKKIVTNNGKRA